MQNIVWAMDHGINWDWFACIELHDDGTATVLGEGRLHKFNRMQGAEQIGAYHRITGTNRYEIIEPKPNYDVWPRPTRKALGVRLNGQEYRLANGPVGRWDFPPLPRL